MKKLGFILVLVLILASLVIAACGGGDEEETGPTATQEPGATEGQGEPTTPPSETDLELPENLKITMEYTYSSEGGSSGTYKYWIKGDKSKAEITMQQAGEEEYTQITIDDGEYSYTYNPDDNTAIKYPSGDMMTAFAFIYLEIFEESYYDYATEAAINAACADDPECVSVKKIGTETVSGHKCDIWEGVSTDGSGKVWVATDTGWPMKFESTYEGETMTMEYTELDMNPSIPDSVFQLPAGVEITDMSSGFDFGGDEFEWPDDFDFE